MGILFVTDNSGIGCAGWALKTLIEDISEILTENGFVELAEWLTSDLSPVKLYSDLDVRDLTKTNQEAFINAIIPAFERSKKRGPVDWHDPSYWDSYIKLFENLAIQIEEIANGRNPKNLANLKGVSIHNGARSGPGWE